tara:strand:+ start:6862 stop:7272 length:411 start_codon:yes stop_codon:yes gene_type:complete
MNNIKRKSPNIEGAVQKNLEKLHIVKQLVKKELFSSIEEIRKEVGGSYKFYSHLRDSGVITKVNHYFVWNDKIPITYKLALTLSEHTRKTRKLYAERNVEISSKAVVNKKVRQPIKPTKGTRREFSLIWGLFKIKY